MTALGAWHVGSVQLKKKAGAAKSMRGSANNTLKRKGGKKNATKASNRLSQGANVQRRFELFISRGDPARGSLRRGGAFS